MAIATEYDHDHCVITVNRQWRRRRRRRRLILGEIDPNQRQCRSVVVVDYLYTSAVSVPMPVRLGAKMFTRTTSTPSPVRKPAQMMLLPHTNFRPLSFPSITLPFSPSEFANSVLIWRG